MKFTTKGLSCYIEDDDATQTADIITSVTNAAPAVVTPTTGASFADGDVVLIEGTGMESIDDKHWIVANHAGTTFELQCSDASGESAAATEGTATPYKFDTDLLKFCLSSFSRDTGTADVIDASTFCGAEQLAGELLPGVISWGGPIDYCDAGHKEMYEAAIDQVDRLVVLKLPKNLGHIVMTVLVNQYAEDFALNAAGTWTGSAVVREEPSYIVCGGCS